MILLRMAVFLVWITAVLMALVKTDRSVNVLFRFQAVGELAVAAVLALTVPYAWLWLTVVAVALIKVVIIPKILFSHDALVQQDYGVRSPFGMSGLLLVFLAVTVFALAFTRAVGIGDPVLAGTVLAALLVSLVHLSARYEVWSISRALLSLETICATGVLVVGWTLKEPADLAIDLVALFLAFTISWVASTLMRLKGSVDVRDMKELIG